MDAAISLNETADSLIRGGVHEVPIEWTDITTGEKCKCRPDCINGDAIVDYKTTTSCVNGAFERDCRMYGYKLQAAMYTEGVLNQYFQKKKFIFIAQEKTPPYAVRVYYCNESFVDEGMELYRELLWRYHECKASGKWPGYESEVLYGE